MQRYFVSPDAIADGFVRLSGGDVHHAKHVMRMRPGDAAEFGDGTGRILTATLVAFEGETARFAVVAATAQEAQGPAVFVAQALIRRERFETMLEKATELGVAGIIPTVFARSVVRFEERDEEKKRARFGLIVKEAAEQAHRADVPTIGPVTSLPDLDLTAYDRVFVCYEAAGPDAFLAKVLVPADFHSRLLFIIGPEGGIEPRELAGLQTRGAVVVSLGRRILRAETASLYVLAAIDALAEVSR